MADGGGAKGTFDYTKVHETLQTLETYYEAFYRAIQEMDMAVAQSIDVGSESSILGTRAGNLLTNWTTYCNGYKSYYNMFRSWSGAIIEASTKYTEYEGTYQNGDAEATKLGDIERTLTADEMKSFDEMHAAAAAAAALVSGNASVSGNTVTVNGTPYEMHTGSNGQKYIEIGGQQYYVNSENGQVTSVRTPDGTVRTPGSMEAQMQAKKDSMTPAEWDSYKAGLTGEQRAAADYIDTGAQIMTTEQAESALTQQQHETPPEATVQLPTVENGDYKAAADQLLDSANNAKDYCYQVTEDAADYAEYYEQVVQQSPYYQSLSPEEQQAYDQQVENYCQGWSDAYNALQQGTKGGVFVPDGVIYDPSSWVTHGDNRGYGAAEEYVNNVNNMTSSNMSPSEFADAMAVFDQVDLSKGRDEQ